nr:MAG TPA: hypothetical protein [Caudoviricetes sp.]
MLLHLILSYETRLFLHLHHYVLRATRFHIRYRLDVYSHFSDSRLTFLFLGLATKHPLFLNT